MVPGESAWTRGFEHWIAGIVSERSLPGRQSPGKDQRTAETIGRTLVDEIFEQTATYFPGELFAFNTISGAMYTIKTGQGDSEVVLATDKALYYRVNDALYRASVEPGKLSEAVEIARSPAIPAVHWAFLGPPLDPSAHQHD